MRRYIVIQWQSMVPGGGIEFAKSFTDGNLAVECANDRLTRANINAAFVYDDLKFVDSSGSLTAKNNSETIKITILLEDE